MAARDVDGFVSTTVIGHRKRLFQCQHAVSSALDEAVRPLVRSRYPRVTLHGWAAIRFSLTDHISTDCLPEREVGVSHFSPHTGTRLGPLAQHCDYSTLELGPYVEQIATADSRETHIVPVDKQP